MNTLQSNPEIVIELHGACTIKTILKAKPADASLVAINQYKSASIFYKSEDGFYFADYTNGRGWEGVCQRCEKELIQDLAAHAFILVDVAALELALQAYPDEVMENPMTVLKARVDAQFTRVSARREHEKNKDSYWQGHYDAYEIVQHMIRQFG